MSFPHPRSYRSFGGLAGWWSLYDYDPVGFPTLMNLNYHRPSRFIGNLFPPRDPEAERSAPDPFTFRHMFEEMAEEESSEETAGSESSTDDSSDWDNNGDGDDAGFIVDSAEWDTTIIPERSYEEFLEDSWEWESAIATEDDEESPEEKAERERQAKREEKKQKKKEKRREKQREKRKEKRREKRREKQKEKRKQKQREKREKKQEQEQQEQNQQPQPKPQPEPEHQPEPVTEPVPKRLHPSIFRPPPPGGWISEQTDCNYSTQQDDSESSTQDSDSESITIPEYLESPEAFNTVGIVFSIAWPHYPDMGPSRPELRRVNSSPELHPTRDSSDLDTSGVPMQFDRPGHGVDFVPDRFLGL